MFYDTRDPLRKESFEKLTVHLSTDSRRTAKKSPRRLSWVRKLDVVLLLQRSNFKSFLIDIV